MFNAEQEVALGDILAESSAQFLQPIKDKALTATLEQIGERLVKHLPPTGLQYRFYVSDAPFANAFSIAGGRVYVTRKLIGNVRSEDELAGVMGHELGHIATHQQAIQFTRMFRERLGITEVKDRQDIFDKFNRWIDERYKLRGFTIKEESDQQKADRVGLEATVRAGYSPQSLADFWDRFTENKGKTGNWFTEFLGTTRPESKRLREMTKSLSNLPEGCKDQRAAGLSEAFHKWQGTIVSYSRLQTPEDLHGLKWKQNLEPPLQDGIEFLKFSPDGKYILAQDSASIYILSRLPFQQLFRIDALDAYPAQFTPDAHSIVFYNPALRVEQWDIATQQQTSVQEIVILAGCVQTALSPDGKTLACVRNHLELDLIDVASGEHLLEKRNFFTSKVDFEQGIGSIRIVVQINFLNLGFSTDGRYFVASLRHEKSLGFDILRRQEIAVPGTLKDYLGTAFAFAGPDRLLGWSGDKGEKSALVKFPSGEIIKRLDFGSARPSPVGRGEFVLLRPIKDFEVGVLDMNTNQIVRASKSSALDMFDDQFISEMKDGEIGLFGASAKPLATVVLPRGRLGRLQTTALSEDANWLAVSGRYHGAVWELKQGIRLLNLREFTGSYLTNDGILFADFPKHDTTARSIARVALKQRQFSEAMRLGEEQSWQSGPYLLSTRPAKKSENENKKNANDSSKSASPEPKMEGLNLRILESDISEAAVRDSILEVRDLQSGSALWSKHFSMEVPRQFADSREKTLVLIWHASEGAAKAEINEHPELRSRSRGMKDDDELIEVVGLDTGKWIGGLLLSTGQGSFHVERVEVAGDWLVLGDTRNRTLVYSLSTGQAKVKVFGVSFAISKTSGLLCLQNEHGILQVYDLESGKKVDEFVFSNPISLARFINKGKQLFVLSSNQTAYLLEPKITTSSSN